MKFGMLQVTTPGGAARDVPIDLPSLLVGRSDDNGVALDDVSVSRRHARIVIEGGNLLVEDLGSASGTFIDGHRIPPHSPSLVEPNQTLRFGNVEARFVPPAIAGAEPEAAPTPAAVSLPVLPPQAAAALPPFVPISAASTPAAPSLEPAAAPAPSVLRLSVVTTAAEVAAGDVLYATATIQNRGRIVEQVSLEIPDLPAEWVTLSSRTVALLPGDRQEVTIVVRPPRRPDATAGQHQFTVLAMAQQQGEQVSATAAFSILPFEAVSASLQPVQAARDFRLLVRNDGNITSNFTFKGTDDEGAFEYDFGSTALEVPPGEARSMSARVKAPGVKLFGQRQVKPFKLVASQATGGAPLEVAGQLALSPPLERTKRPAMLLLGLLGLAAIAALAFVLWPRGDKAPPAKTEPTTTVLAAAPTPTPTPDTRLVDASSPCATAAQIQQAQQAVGRAPAAPQVPLKAELFRQNDPRWGKDVYARANDPRDECGATIGSCGCAMTSLTNVLSAFNLLVMPDGQPLNPKAVNDYFNQDAKRLAGGWVSKGYSFNNVQWGAVDELSRKVAEANPGVARIAWVPRWGSASDEEIRRELTNRRPVILQLYIRSATYTGPHFVLAYALGTNGDILIKDPSHEEIRTINDYRGFIQNSRLFQVVQPGDDLSALVITVPSNLRVTIKDDKGRIVGSLTGATADDAQKNARLDIPGATYQFQPAWRDAECLQQAPAVGSGTIQIIIPRPADGSYTVDITDPNGGPTSVDIRTYDTDGNSSVTGSSDPRLQIDWKGPQPTPGPSPTSPATIAATATTRPTSVSTATTLPTSTSTATATPTVPATATATPTSAPTPTPTVTRTPTPPGHTAPVQVSLGCTGSINSDRVITVNCTVTVVGEYTTIAWKVNGVALSGPNFDNKKTITYSFPSPAGGQITVNANVCNFEACNAGAFSASIQ